MGKRGNSKLECELNVLSNLLTHLYRKLDKTYNSKEYKAWSELGEHRRDLYSQNDKIIEVMVEAAKDKDADREEDIQKHVCELSLCSIYMKAMEYKSYEDTPELYQAYLEKIKPHEKEYVLNQQRIGQINEQIAPYEKYMNDTQEQRDELRAVKNYLWEQIDILTSSFGFHKLSDEYKIKIVKKRLRSYPIDKKTLLDIQKEADAYKEAWLKRYKIHSGKMDGMPRPPQYSRISDPTGDALMMMEEAYEEIIKQSAEKARKASDNIQWVESRLDRLNATERRIVDLYYFNDSSKRITWQDVAEQLNYNHEYCKQMDREIIIKLTD